MILTCTADRPYGRLDAFVPIAFPTLSRNYAKTLIQQGFIQVDGKVTVKPSSGLLAGQTVTVDLPDPVTSTMRAQAMDLDIVYEDEDLLIINKQQGMVVHPAPGHYDGTLANALMHHCRGNLSDINGVIRPGIIHRIDKDTSGLLIAVKNNEAHRILAQRLAHHEIKRYYRACVHGVLDVDEGTIDAPITRSPSNRKKMAVGADGKPSVTHFEVVRRYALATDVHLCLETGRTHQIRCHMAYIQHPLMGDRLYAGKKPNYDLAGQALHSKRISFLHPRDDRLIDIAIDLPPYYISLLSWLGEER